MGRIVIKAPVDRGAAGRPPRPLAISVYLQVAKASWQVPFLAVLAYGAIVAGAKGVIPNAAAIGDLVLGGFMLIAIPCALIGLVGVVLEPERRGRLLVHSLLGLGLIAGLAAIAVPNFLASRGRLTKNAAAEKALGLEMKSIAAAKNTTNEERTRKAAAAMQAAVAQSTGDRKKVLSLFSVALESQIETVGGYEKSMAAFTADGAMSIEAFVSPDKIDARRALLVSAIEAMRRYKIQLETIDGAFDPDRLVAEEEREDFLGAFVRRPIARMELELAIANEMDQVLQGLRGSWGKWKIEDGSVRFKKPADESAYNAHVEKLRKLAGVTPVPTPADVPASTTTKGVPAFQALAGTEAQDLAKSYITLIKRGHFDEAYKYLPADLRATVTAKVHKAYWVKAAGVKREEISLDEVTALEGGAVGFRVGIPGAKEPEVLVVFKTAGKVYASPLALLAD